MCGPLSRCIMHYWNVSECIWSIRTLPTITNLYSAVSCLVSTQNNETLKIKYDIWHTDTSVVKYTGNCTYASYIKQCDWLSGSWEPITSLDAWCIFAISSIFHNYKPDWLQPDKSVAASNIKGGNLKMSHFLFTLGVFNLNYFW